MGGDGVDEIAGVDGVDEIAGVDGVDEIAGVDGVDEIAGVDGVDEIAGMDGEAVGMSVVKAMEACRAESMRLGWRIKRAFVSETEGGRESLASARSDPVYTISIPL